MSITSRISLFNTSAQNHVDTASTLLGIQSTLAHLRHYSAEAHASSLLYPLCHVLKTVISAARIAQGGLLLLGALLEKPSTNIPAVLDALALELGALILNALNAITASFVLLTGSLTSFSFGYPNKAIEAAPRSFLGDLFFGIYNKAEDFLYEETTSLTR